MQLGRVYTLKIYSKKNTRAVWCGGAAFRYLIQYEKVSGALKSDECSQQQQKDLLVSPLEV